MTNKKVILIDIDESIYPFAHTFHDWLTTQSRSLPWEDLSIEYDLDKYLHDHVALQPHFVKAHGHIVNPQPIVEALEALELLHPHYILRACTARNRYDWEELTEKWVGEHFPNIDDIIYTREERGDDAVHKKHLAQHHKAHALIDDTALWVQDLPEHTHGFVVERPKPLASDREAKTWKEISSTLWSHATRYQ